MELKRRPNLILFETESKFSDNNPKAEIEIAQFCQQCRFLFEVVVYLVARQWGASIGSVSEGVPELSAGINYSCRIMPQPVRIWVTPRKDWNSRDIFLFS